MGSQGPEAHLLWYASPTCEHESFLLALTARITGKILKDEDTIETYKIEEKGFVVCMVNKVWTCKLAEVDVIY